MRSGSGQRPRGRFSGNRPLRPNQQRAPQRNQTFDSSGPSVKLRGDAHQIFERYVALAREAAIGGDPVAAENLYQHAEHYFRVANANREGAQQGSAPRPTTPADAVTDGPERASDEGDGERGEPGWGDDRPGFL
jgi:Domain of unknown function (DUF4167)